MIFIQKSIFKTTTWKLYKTYSFACVGGIYQTIQHPHFIILPCSCTCKVGECVHNVDNNEREEDRCHHPAPAALLNAKQ